jgi:beta-glucuronidase
MRRRLPPFLPLLAVALAAALAGASGAVAATPPPGGTAPPYTVDTPSARPHSVEGQDGRYLLDGPWLMRTDPTDAGLGQRLYAQSTTSGWTATTVPSAWNAGDDSQASFLGSIAWYRKDFRLPSRDRALAWIARFESVNYHATVWLNGRRVGRHVSGYVPFELDLPNVKHGGVNRLVVRVDNRRTVDPTGAPGELPQPPGGWWNYGGLLREVSLRAVDRVDVGEVQVQTALSGPRGPATITTRATVRNVSSVTQTVELTGRFGRARIDLGLQVLPPRSRRVFEGAIVVRGPRLWSPAKPALYDVRLAATAARGRARPTRAAGYGLRTGIRTLDVSGRGQLILNKNVVVRFRGVALHEDTLTRGPVMTRADREKIVALMKESGSTLLRAHYPLDPDFQDLADEEGILIWSEIPATYQLPEANLGRKAFRVVALRQLAEDVVANRNHPSVAVWSVGNEMASAAGPNQASYLRAASALARELDPTRPVGLAFAGHPETPCQAAYGPIDFLGMNDYFGWYTGFGGNIADRDLLPSFLDDLRRCYPRTAIAVTEYGAEANRDGPAEEKGTYQFQDEFIAHHLAAFATRRWLTGGVYWALQEFRVRPFWGGGNPWPASPYHQKGVVRLDFTKKPGFATLAAGHGKVRQFVTRRAGR